jgi:hypothetical protein
VWVRKPINYSSSGSPCVNQASAGFRVFIEAKLHRAADSEVFVLFFDISMIYGIQMAQVIAFSKYRVIGNGTLA